MPAVPHLSPIYFFSLSMLMMMIKALTALILLYLSRTVGISWGLKWVREKVMLGYGWVELVYFLVVGWNELSWALGFCLCFCS